MIQKIRSKEQLKKASGFRGVSYEEVVYEGYGPNGVAIIIEATRTIKIGLLLS